jgi:DNA primase catalytic subunit
MDEDVCAYYAAAFPHAGMFAFLTRVAPIDCREFSLNPDVRHLCVSNAASYKMLVAAAGGGQHHVGGIYARAPVVENNTCVLGSEPRIDIDDYRACNQCAPRKICARCWAYEMAPRMQRIMNVLHQTFGVHKEDMRALYSGGRSAHCWLLTPSLFVLQQEGRVEFLEQVMKHVNADNPTKVVVDAAVFTQLNHLIRSPFSYNPSGNLCLPVDLWGSDSPFVTPSQALHSEPHQQLFQRACLQWMK